MDLNQLNPLEIVEVGRLLADQSGQEFQKVASEDSLPDLNTMTVAEFIEFASLVDRELEKEAAVGSWIKSTVGKAGEAGKDIVESLGQGLKKAKTRFEPSRAEKATEAVKSFGQRTKDTASKTWETAKGDASHFGKALKGDLGADAARRARVGLGLATAATAVPTGVALSSNRRR